MWRRISVGIVGAREAESSALSDINDLGRAAPCTADGEGGVQENPAAYRNSFKEGRGMMPFRNVAAASGRLTSNH